MRALSRFDEGLRWYERLGAIVGTTIFVVVAVVFLRGHSVGAWVPVVVGVVLLVAAYLAYRRGRLQGSVAPDEGQRAVAELEVANNYLTHVRDFMEGLRLSAVGLPPDQAIPKLQALRELVFDAIIQGINSGPGEHIRCALFEPVTTEGETRFRVRSHRGHTYRVEHLALHLNSVAGASFTAREPIYVPDADADQRVERTAAGRPVKTLFCLPLYTFRANQQDPVGVFSVASNRSDAFSASDRAFISACADMIGVVEFFIGVWEQMRQQSAVVAAPPAQPVHLPPPASPPLTGGESPTENPND